ncbi:MAG TPA: NAD(P)H-dependent oxidoreductase [Solirubrobacteraceae bacterium]|jgi:chromate reductase|nr:NAD(P)H-dependent oxidoreductase [Solirubrobacteraceae bacterium]
MRILGISGSLRRDSHNTRLLRGVGALLPEGVELEIFDQLGAIPPYSEDEEHATPPAVAALKAAIAGADALLVATPEYNASIPGVLKNALDWVSRPVRETPLMGKPAAVIGASTGLFGAVWAQAETRKVLATIGARVVDREIPIGQADDALGADGLPLDGDARELIEATVTELLELAEPGRVAA